MSGQPFLHEETIDVLAEIRDELHGIAVLLAPKAVLEPGYQMAEPSPEILPGRPRRPELLKALRLVRAALDSDSNMGEEDIERLHEAEELLCQELGNPIWEGRTEQ